MDLNSILENILIFILTMYGNPSFPRNLVQIVIDNVHNLHKNIILPSLKDDILNVLQDLNVPAEKLDKIEHYFHCYGSVFENTLTEHKRFQLLRNKGFIDPEKFMMGSTFVPKSVAGKILMVPESLYGVQVPLRKTLKLFLEIPGLLYQIKEYISKLSQESQIITNIMQAGLWIQKYSGTCHDAILLPLYIFFDDLEVGNPLGSHAGINKFGVVYATIACLI